MRPFDPRLLKYAGATRWLLVVLAFLGLAQAFAAISLAWCIASAVTAVFVDSKQLTDITGLLVALTAVLLVRPVLAYGQQVLATRASARVKNQLSCQVVSKAAELGPGWLIDTQQSRLVLLLQTGLDALDDYFARYLPGLIDSVVVTATVVIAVFLVDPLSAMVIMVTLPLIPVFMVLIGWRTQIEQRRHWDSMQLLGGHFLDLLRGLLTLKIFNRAEAQSRSISEVSELYRRRTLKVLRISFLSSFALELIATLSVAVVAVEVGIRLVEGRLDLFTALFVLVLAPEAYLPLRQVGVNYHASQAGLAAAEEAFEILERPSPAVPDHSVDLWSTPITFKDVQVQYRDRDASSFDGNFTIEPGELLALVGPSGAGKSTALACLVGIVRPTSGTVSANGADDAAHWRTQVSWMPQHPGFVNGTVGDNVRIVAPDASDEAVRSALARAGADFVGDLDRGIDTELGEGATRLSAGQRQRIALARVFVRDTPLVALDEVTAGLDTATEARVVAAITELGRERSVVLVAHRAALAAAADRTVTLHPSVTADSGGRRG